MRAKKSYGQHFLQSEHIAQKIARSLQQGDEVDRIVEVGPGKGMLTQYLIEEYDELSVVESDFEMVNYLDEHYPELASNIIFFDILKFSFRKAFNGEQIALIGNYPYNISSQIVFRVLKYREMIPEMVGMFQYEMARRIASDPGSKEYGVISVLTQAHYRCEYLFKVKRGHFRPMPKVQSAVIRLTRKEEPLGCDEHLFKMVVKSAFSQRRKMLRNTMKTFIKGDPILKEPFFRKRPEQLSLEEFVTLTNEIDKRYDEI